MSSTAIVPAKSASTPIKKTPQITESPGNWKHPRLAEITRRQNATVFTKSNAKTICYNVAALVIVHSARQFWFQYPRLFRWVGQEFRDHVAGWLWLFLFCIPVVNIALALLPLMRKKDDLSDIPLTPAQRKLLGLPPSSVPPTPGTAYSTPPKYSRTPSMSGSVGSNKSYTGSPLSGKGSPVLGGRLSGSPYSPVGSPLLQKAVGGVRRSSFGSPGPLGASSGSNMFLDTPATPSPSSGKRASVGLNSKWLYEKGRRSSGGGVWMQ